MQVREDEPVLNAFQIMRNKGVGGLPVVDGSGRKAIGTISIRDIHYLLTQHALCDKYRFVCAKISSCLDRFNLQCKNFSSS